MQEKRNYIRTKLAEHNLSQKWLKKELEKNGVNTSKTVLCETINGNRHGKKAEVIIEMSVKILEKYEQKYVLGA